MQCKHAVEKKLEVTNAAYMQWLMGRGGTQGASFPFLAKKKIIGLESWNCLELPVKKNQ